jgi:hypothetical protein
MPRVRDQTQKSPAKAEQKHALLDDGTPTHIGLSSLGDSQSTLIRTTNLVNKKVGVKLFPKEIFPECFVWGTSIDEAKKSTSSAATKKIRKAEVSQ